MRDKFAASALTALAATSADALWLIDRDRKLAYANDAFRDFCARMGRTVPDLGSPVETALPGEWMDLAERALSDRTVQAESSLESAAGRRRYTVAATPVHEDGAIAGVVFALRDITDYRRSTPHEFLELALARIFADDRAADPMRRVLEIFCEAVGWDLGISWIVRGDTLQVEAVWHMAQIDARPMLELLDETAFRRGHGVPGRVWERGEPLAVSDLWDETGAVRAMRVRASGLHGVVGFPVTDSSGSVLRVLEFFARQVRHVDAEQLETLRHVGREIGRWIERKQVEQERASLQELLVKKGREWSMTFDAIDSPIFIVDSQSAITRLNRAARLLAGAADYQEILGRTISSLGDKEPWPTLGRLAAVVRASGVTADTQIATGRQRWDVSASIAPAGNESRVVLFMRDVTTLIELQETLRRSERLTAMGELVAGVAHEVRNPLFGMSATLDTWELLKDDPESPAELIPALRKWIDRLNLLMERLLDYGKVSDLVLTDAPIGDVIEAAVDSCAPLAEKGRITIVREVAAALPPVRMDSSRLVQAVENLLINAIQHSPAGSTVRICARARDDERVECAVIDAGPGFAPGDLARVFQPFFTRRRGGTGLGLSIVSRVVEEHGGTIAAANATAGGAEVTMILPAHARDSHDVRSTH